MASIIVILSVLFWNKFTAFFDKSNSWLKIIFLFFLNWSYFSVFFIPGFYQRVSEDVISKLIQKGKYSCAAYSYYFGTNLLNSGEIIFIDIMAFVVILACVNTKILKGSVFDDNEAINYFNLKTSRNLVDFYFTVSVIIIAFICVLFNVNGGGNPSIELNSMVYGVGISFLPLMASLHYLESEIPN